MCLCGALGASARNLPEEVLSEVRRFFNLDLRRMTRAGIARSDAFKLFATLEGAIMMANVLGSHEVFDEATACQTIVGCYRLPKAKKTIGTAYPGFEKTSMPSQMDIAKMLNACSSKNRFVKYP
jgi:hypothetical protein